MKKRRHRKKNWEKLDNTAVLFPAIASEETTNVYRISVNLTEEVDAELLQKALDMVLPGFDTFNVCMQKGIFWYYFETNNKPAPKVVKEHDFPCRYIEPYSNNNYLFRITYYRKRINLEVFHVLADGMGGINFLREVTYQYLRLKYPEIAAVKKNRLSEHTSLNTEDSYVKNYKKGHAKGYETKRAVEVKGEKLSRGELGVMHGYMSVKQVKQAAKKYDTSINEYFVIVFMYSVYVEYLKRMRSDKPIVCAVPVNLRPFFDSMTTRNFFVMVSAVFKPEKDEYSFEEIADIVKKSLRGQITKEHLEDLFSYNVSNQKNILLRSIPFFIKKITMKLVYLSSAKANTSTVTNIGNIKIDEEYAPFIKSFHAMISISTGQNIKGAICSYNDTMVFTFTSILRDTAIQRGFFRKLVEDGVDISIESNEVYYD